jgi:hypothetical protein
MKSFRLSANDKMLFGIVGLIFILSVLMFVKTLWVLNRTYEVKGTIIKVSKITLNDKRHTVVNEARIKYRANDNKEYELAGRVASHFKQNDSIKVRVYKKSAGEGFVFLDGFPFTQELLVFVFGVFMLVVAVYQARENSKKLKF